MYDIKFEIKDKSNLELKMKFNCVLFIKIYLK